MKILYAVQGTGNGHITRSSSIIEHLKNKADVDVLISGFHNEVKMPFETKYKLNGLGFKFGKSGGIDLIETIRKNNLKHLFKEIKNLPIKNYDMVVSDFEPLSVWAASKNHVPSVGLSNQASILNPEIDKPFSVPLINKIISKNYAQCDLNIGIHYNNRYQNTVTPIIRDELRKGINNDDGFGLVYLPFYSDEIIFDVLKNIKMIKWHVFSKHSKFAYKRSNINFEPITTYSFTEKLLKCNTVITAAGFGTTSEALFLGKKLIVIPMKNQYEQKFNAFTLKKLGVKIIQSLKHPDSHYQIVNELSSDFKLKIDYPDNAEDISTKLFELCYHTKSFKRIENAPDFEKFKDLIGKFNLNNVPGNQISF